MDLLPSQRAALAGLKCLFGIVLLGFVIWLLAMGCGCQPKREEIAVYHSTSVTAARIASELEAKDKGGLNYLVGDTASMAPTILPHDYVVAIKTSYADLKIGMVINYFASWNNGKLTCHRIVALWPSGGWILEGDSAKNVAETKWTMDATNYVDHVVSIYRFP